MKLIFLLADDSVQRPKSQDTTSTMPLKAINDSDLSDAECPALKGKPSATPKPKPEPKKLQLPMKAKSAAKPKAAPAALPSQQEPTAPEQTKVANVLKRPAAAKANPSTAEGPPHKKPAAAKATKKPPTGRAYKYCYHQKEMYGIKRDGSELCTARVLKGLLATCINETVASGLPYYYTLK